MGTSRVEFTSGQAPEAELPNQATLDAQKYLADVEFIFQISHHPSGVLTQGWAHSVTLQWLEGTMFRTWSFSLPTNKTWFSEILRFHSGSSPIFLPAIAVTHNHLLPTTILKKSIKQYLVNCVPTAQHIGVSRCFALSCQEWESYVCPVYSSGSMLPLQSHLDCLLW